MGIKEVIDETGQLEAKVKAMSLKIATNKEKIRSHAAKYQLNEVEGDECIAKVSPVTSTEISPEDLHSKLKEMGMEHLYYGLVKVQVAPTRKSIGEVVFDSISTSTIKEYARVQVTKK